MINLVVTKLYYKTDLQTAFPENQYFIYYYESKLILSNYF